MMKIHSQRASALLIAIFLMTILTIIGFGTSRVYIGEIRTTNKLINSTAAYYAAEGRLEESLLEYRQNKSIDEPDLANEYQYSNEAKTKRSISHSGSTITDMLIKQDEAKEVSIDNGKATISWDDVNGVVNPANFRGVRIRRFDIASFNLTHNTIAEIFKGSADRSLTIDGSTAGEIVRIRPLGSNIRIDVTPVSGSSPKIGQDIVTIKSLGEYGSDVKRQLQAQVNASTGQLDGVFDYTILSKGTL